VFPVLIVEWFRIYRSRKPSREKTQAVGNWQELAVVKAIRFKIGRKPAGYDLSSAW
jgi:hypothetical protein